MLQCEIDLTEFKSQHDAFKKGYRLEKGRIRTQKSRIKLTERKGLEYLRKQYCEWKTNSRSKLIAEKGSTRVKEAENEWESKRRAKQIEQKGLEQVQAEGRKKQAKSRARRIEQKGLKQVQAEGSKKTAKNRSKMIVEKGPIKVRYEENERKAKSRANLIKERGIAQVTNQEKNRKLQSRKRKMQIDPKSVHANEKSRKRQSRLVDSAKKRLRKFMQQTMFNAIFTCSCCQRNLFDCNVSNIDSKLITYIETKKPGLFQRAIEHQIQVKINGKTSSYICHACKKHLKAGKMPPMSAKNGLRIPQHDPELELTELEGNLIAKRIIFMKIFQLPKSRWTALKDKVVNIPVNENDILNTVTRLPRTPNEAGLIEVDLKRKVEYKNSHLKQLINPDKCFRMLEILKKRGNPHYQFYDDYNTFKERCKKSESTCYSFIHDDEVPHIVDIAEETGVTSIEEVLEREYQTKDPVKKYQLQDYNKSLCMSNMYPEIGSENSVILAPGEGKVPQNVLYDNDWDIKAFPHINSPDGKYGLHHPRGVKLSDQYYFIQRICNQNPKFARNSAYVYAAVAHTELKQIQRNINVSYSRGKEINNTDGVKTLKLDDPYSVLDDIKQTPRYWRKGKFEMFAKLDNFGPFQFFFTLSCADLRWDENFAAILRNQQCNIIYEVEDDKDGFPRTAIYVAHEKDGKIPIKKYVAEYIDESLHECIRGNVLLATRYFNHRVKSFINNIVMGGGNTMMVDKFAYKAEFQDRGALRN